MVKSARSSKSKPASRSKKVKASRGSRAPLDQLIKTAIKQACVRYNTEEPDIDTVMMLIGSSYSPGSVSNSIRKLKKEGSAETPTSKTIRLTEKANAEVGHVELPTNEENLAEIKDRLTGKAKLLLDIMYKDGRAHSREELEATLGNMAKGSKDNTIRQVRQLIETEEFKDSNGKTMYRLKDIAFPQGRPNAN